mgnify:CR=1 FL=1
MEAYNRYRNHILTILNRRPFFIEDLAIEVEEEIESSPFQHFNMVFFGEVIEWMVNIGDLDRVRRWVILRNGNYSKSWLVSTN